MNTKMQRKDAVLLVLPWSPNYSGGVSIVVKSLSQQFSIRAKEPTVVVSDWTAKQITEANDGTLHFRFALFHGAGPLGIAKSILALPLRVWRTRSLLRTSGVTAVNFHYASLDALVVALLKRMRLFDGRLVLSFHGTDARQPESATERRLWRWLIDTADGVSACSVDLARRVAQVLNTDIGRISVLYNGVDSTKFSLGKPRSPGCSAQLPNRYIVSVGSFIARKGHQVLLDAFRDLANTFPDVALVIVGMDGDQRLPLIEGARALGLSDRLHCVINLDQDAVAEIVSNAAVCVQPSHAEPFGLAVIEAGACGVPVVASAVGGHLELLRDGHTGFLFPAGNAGYCSAQVSHVLSNADNASAVAASFRQEVLERFTWQACADNYLRLLFGATSQTSLSPLEETSDVPKREEAGAPH